MRRDSLRAAVALSTIGLAPAGPLFAAEGAGEEAHHGAHAASMSELILPTINFAIFAFILVKYVVPALREYLRRRAADIVSAAATSRTLLGEAEALLAAARARANGVASERETIRSDVVTAATRQAERLHEQAEETGKRRLADAALVAEQERRRALEEVRAEIAALATSLAESRLRAVLSSDDQRTFVQQFLEDAPVR
jgi:F-type H+-transporting ATPase subunit b